jgi:hypothetical protein
LGTVHVIYHIAGVADFNGDGKADLVWENTATGTRAIWFLNNGVYSSAGTSPAFRPHGTSSITEMKVGSEYCCSLIKRTEQQI